MSSKKEIYYYRVYNITIRSCFKIQELWEIEPQDTDIVLRENNLPNVLADSYIHGHLYENVIEYQISKSDVLLYIQNRGRYNIKNKKEIIIDRLPNVSDEDIAINILGVCLSFLILLNGYFAIHGSAIKIGDNCVIFAGESGVGKSTTAAKLISKGNKLLADDMCVISFNTEGKPFVYPAFPQLRLWDSSVEKLGILKENLKIVSENWMKYRIPARYNYQLEPVPLTQIFELKPSDLFELKIVDLYSLDKMAVLLSNTHLNIAVQLLQKQNEHFQFCSKLAQKVEIKSIQRPKNKFLLDELVDLIESEIIISI